MPKIEIIEPDDIAALPWAGNFADDAPLFRMVDAYILREPDLAKRQRAEELVNWHGMGKRVKCRPDYDPRGSRLLRPFGE